MTVSSELIAAIANLHLVARTIVSSGTMGIHAGSRHGTSTEFLEHRAYFPGDEIKHIDWRAYAKTQRLHIKRYEDETSLRVILLVDASGSMGFASDKISKLGRASELAAAIAYLTLAQGDSVGLIAGQGTNISNVPVARGVTHLQTLLACLASLEPTGKTDLIQLGQRALDLSRNKNTVTIMLSDLFDPNPSVFDELRLLANKLGDLRILQILDPAEITFPFEQPSTFLSMESDQKLFSHPRTIKAAYLKAMHTFLDKTQRVLHGAGVIFSRTETHEDPRHALQRFISHQASLPRRVIRNA